MSSHTTQRLAPAPTPPPPSRRITTPTTHWIVQSADWVGPRVTAHLLNKIKISYSRICAVFKITFTLSSCLGYKTLVYCIRYKSDQSQLLSAFSERSIFNGVKGKNICGFVEFYLWRNLSAQKRHFCWQRIQTDKQRYSQDRNSLVTTLLCHLNDTSTHNKADGTCKWTKAILSEFDIFYSVHRAWIHSHVQYYHMHITEIKIISIFIYVPTITLISYV